jgi:hypothetical protein
LPSARIKANLPKRKASIGLGAFHLGFRATFPGYANLADRPGILK